jgi:predicted peptidase
MPLPSSACILLLLILTLGLGVARAAQADEVYTKHPIGSTTAPYGFVQYLPPDYKAKGKAKHPLVFFMHGLGELGDSANDLPKITVHGPFKHLIANDAIAKLIAAQSAIVIAPQGLKADNWWKTEKLTATLAFAIAQHPVDLDRVYVTGLSMGGGGTWAVATAMPEQVAAIVPICAAAGVGDVKKLRGIPIWAHHALNDGVVKFPDNTQRWFDAILKDLGVAPADGVLTGYGRSDKPWLASLTAKGWTWQEGAIAPTAGPKGALPSLMLTVHPDGSHDSWSRTYQNPAVWEWLFRQSRARRATVPAAQ